MRRRTFVAGAAAALAARPVCAQSPAVRRRIAILSGGSQSSAQGHVNCFLTGLRDLKWSEDNNLDIVYRWTGGLLEPATAMAAELVRMKPDLIVATSTICAQAVQRATKDIPVVFIAVSDPVASGIVPSLARPGGNVTGFSNALTATSSKLIEFIKAFAPAAARIGAIHNPQNPGKLLDLQDIRAAARSLKIEIEPLEVRSAADFERVFLASTQSRCDALITLQDGLTLENRFRIVQFAARSRLPAIYQIREFIDAGGLMSYGVNFCRHYRSAATYVDRILKGAVPKDLPIELPTAFELVINRKSAAALGLDIPILLLARADEVIE